MFRNVQKCWIHDTIQGKWYEIMRKMSFFFLSFHFFSVYLSQQIIVKVWEMCKSHFVWFWLIFMNARCFNYNFSIEINIGLEEKVGKSTITMMNFIWMNELKQKKKKRKKKYILLMTIAKNSSELTGKHSNTHINMHTN